MDVLDLPFNRFVGIGKSDRKEFLLMLGESEDYKNHLGTVHASAQFALAEASSGEFLLRTFSDRVSGNMLPVVRRVEIKYSKPANGKLYSSAAVEKQEIERVVSDLTSKGRTILKINIEIEDEAGVKTMQSVFEWFIQKLA